MNNYLSRLHYANFRYLEFPGSAVIQGFIPGTNITKKYVLAKKISFQFLFNINLQKINPYYRKIKKYILVLFIESRDLDAIN